MLTALVLAAAIAAQGNIVWRPAGTNYVQGPLAVAWQGAVYVGGHAGHFGEPWYKVGNERPWMIRYDSSGVTAQDHIVDLLPNAHEFGFASIVRVNGWWLYSAIYTTWDTLGQDNRTHLMFAMTEDLLKTPYPYVWWDLPLPAGGIMSSFVWMNDKLLLFYGDSIYQLAIHTAGPYKAPALMRLGSVPAFPWSDIALGDDNRLYALVSGRADLCWWWNCPSVDEWVSDDGGLTWMRGERTWFFGGEYIGDACYVRSEEGHIKRDSLTIIAVVTPNPDPASGTWYFHWWTDDRASLPISWGCGPGWRTPRIRRHLEREPKMQVFVQP